MIRIGALVLFGVLALAQPHVSITHAQRGAPPFPKTRDVYAKRNVRLLDAVALAFHTDARHVDAPQWLKTVRYDIVVDGDGESPIPVLREALVQKFGLVTDWEWRTVFDRWDDGVGVHNVSERFLVVKAAKMSDALH